MPGRRRESRDGWREAWASYMDHHRETSRRQENLFLVFSYPFQANHFILLTILSRNTNEILGNPHPCLRNKKRNLGTTSPCLKNTIEILGNTGCPEKKSYFQNTAGATVPWLNHHLQAPLVCGDWWRLSRIKHPQVMSMGKFSPIALNLVRILFY